MKSYVIANDLQMPFHHRRVVELFIKFALDIQPDGIILNGDIVDSYRFSDFAKNPMEATQLKDEVKWGHWLMDKFKHVKEKHWLGGNHEDRHRKYVW